MSDIVIRRCTVEVVRHGGWSWGPQPRRLIDQVLAALPGLVEARLAALAPDDDTDDVEITEPVRIALSLTLADLQAGRVDPLQHATLAHAHSDGVDALRHVAVAAGPYPRPLPATQPTRSEPGIHPHAAPPEPMSPVPAAVETLTLAEFLGRLFQRGELAQFLALLPDDTLEAWYRSLTTSDAQAPDTPAGSTAFPATPAEHLPGGAAHPATAATAPAARASDIAQTAWSRYLREAITAIAARVGGERSADPLVAADPTASAPDRRAPTGPAPSDPPRPHEGTAPSTATAAGISGLTAPSGQDTPAGAAAAHTAASAGPTTAARPPTSATPPPFAAASTLTTIAAAAADVEVSCALPFLLLGPLAQIGYLSALTPALQPAGLESQTAVFASALAYTVLGPLQRAWRRRPEDLAAAAALTGLAAPVPGAALTEFARLAPPALPALDAVITQALAEGHTEGQPLVLTAATERSGGGLLLLDREGLFPIAWADTGTGLLPAWRMFGSPPILVAPAAVGALRDLTAAGARFVVATPPGRGDDWRRLPPHRLWTNDHDDPALARHAGGYRQAVDLADELMQALVVDRAAVPLAASPALGRSLLLAAGLGLGTLAWTLWREREPTDPLLALERFADLSARVSFEPDRVRVRLPLGPRHADLSAHGLLADVPGAPWLGGRRVEFSGG